MNGVVQSKVVIKNIWHCKAIIQTFMYKAKHIVLVK